MGTDLALPDRMTTRRNQRSSWDDISDDVITNVDGAAVSEERTSVEGFPIAGNTLDLYVDEDPSSGFSKPRR